MLNFTDIVITVISKAATQFSWILLIKLMRINYISINPCLIYYYSQIRVYCVYSFFCVLLLSVDISIWTNVSVNLMSKLFLSLLESIRLGWTWVEKFKAEMYFKIFAHASENSTIFVIFASKCVQFKYNSSYSTHVAFGVLFFSIFLILMIWTILIKRQKNQ